MTAKTIWETFKTLFPDYAKDSLKFKGSGMNTIEITRNNGSIMRFTIGKDSYTLKLVRGLGVWSNLPRS